MFGFEKSAVIRQGGAADHFVEVFGGIYLKGQHLKKKQV
jgi:hypothetical protein